MDSIIPHSEAWRFNDQERQMLTDVGFSFEIKDPNDKVAQASEGTPDTPAECVVAEIRSHIVATTAPGTNGQLLPGDQEQIRSILARHNYGGDPQHVRLTFGATSELTRMFIDAIHNPQAAAHQGRLRAALEYVLSLQQ